MKSYDIKFWEIRPGKAKKKRTWEARWKVGPQEHSRTFGNKELAKSFMSDLRQAAKNGEAFDIEEGLPDSMLKAKSARRVLPFAVAYVDMKWPGAAPKSRDSMTDALSAVLPALMSEELPDWLEVATARRALRHFALDPGRRMAPRPQEIAQALRWMEKAGLLVADLAKSRHARAALDALSVNLDGMAAAPNTIRRKRAVFSNLLNYAVELEELASNPLDRLSWKPPKTSDVVDRRVVVNPRQARELLTAVTYVGVWRRGLGRRLMPVFACMYYAGLRPAEAVALRLQDCHLPKTGWGRLTLEKSRPEVTRRWTDTGSTHDVRGLKHRAEIATRGVPIPPELVRILRAHVEEYGAEEDGRLLRTERGGVVGSTALGKVWAAARRLALAPEQVISPLAGRPYDLRHAAVSLWLNAGVAPTDVAERAGHSVNVLLQVYAKCLDGGEEVANKRIEAALHAA